jgi:hypothetical protein
LTGFHSAFNSFCKDYFSAEYLYEKCCDEFSLLHKDSTSRENQICDEAFIMEENIFHEDQHVSFEYSDVEEKVYYAIDISPDYEAEINDKLVKKTREDSSLFFPSFSELKVDFVCCSYE